MASRDYPYLSRLTHVEAVAHHEEDLWERSFRENVCCARAIEKALRVCELKGEHIPGDCAAQVLDEYGFKRVSYLLAYAVKDMEGIPVISHDLSRETREWAHGFPVTADMEYGRYYCVDTAAKLLDEFAWQVREAYQTLGLFESVHCSAGMYEGNVKGKVLVLSPDSLKESAWSQENQLWLATGGFGCDPKAGGRAIYATCLGDGEQTRWNREDFCGVLDEQYLPDWAWEKLEQTQEPEAAPVMSAMEMG